MKKVICPYCKSELEADEAANKIKCKYCGADVSTSSNNNSSKTSGKTFADSSLNKLDEVAEKVASSAKDTARKAFSANKDKKPNAKWIIFGVVIFIVLIVLISKSCGNTSTSGNTSKITAESELTIPDVMGMDSKEAVEILNDTGFSNVIITSEIDDGKWKVISQQPEAGAVAKAADAIKLACEKQYSVKFEITSEGNWIFSKYDIDVYADSDNIGTVQNGETISGETFLTEGPHTIKFVNAEKEEMVTPLEINVAGDTTIKCDLKHDGSGITVKNLNIVSTAALSNTPGEAVGTYVGENGSLLVLYDNGKAYYYYYSGPYTNMEERDINWYVDGDKLAWESEKLMCLISAAIPNGDYSELEFDSDSSNWDAEKYIRIDDEPATVDADQAKKLIEDSEELFLKNETDEGNNVVNASEAETETETEEETQPENFNNETEETEKIPVDDNASKYDLAYMMDCGEYYIYYVFDTKSKEVLRFTTSDTYVGKGTYTGDFDSGIKIYWPDEDYYSKMKRKTKGKDSILLDALDGDSYDFEFKKVAVPLSDSHLK